MSKLELLKKELNAESIPFSCDECLALHTTFRIGGPADIFCRPQSQQQLIKTIELCREQQMRIHLLGKGSNVLFHDRGFNGVVICTSELKEPIHVEGTTINASAGASLAQVCKAALQNELTGLEFAYGIPGSIGGAVYMNAGAYGGEMKDVIQSVTYLDSNGNILTKMQDELKLGYRTSLFAQQGGCVLSVKLSLQKGESQKIQARMTELLGRRKDKQPLEYPSAGSTFKRPEGAFAGELIQRCGLRGARVGDAAISEKHCGFVVNLGHASCADVVKLTDLVRETVKRETGFDLEKEIRVVE